MPAITPRIEPRRHFRFAVVLYGGSSLAIYINGIAQEIHHLVRATAADPDAPDRALVPDEQLTHVERVYRHLGQVLSSDGRALDAPYDPAATIYTQFVVDIVSGTSAGGINGVFLCKGLATGAPLTQLERMWLDEGDFAALINDPLSCHGEPGLTPQRPPRSALNGRRMYRKLYQALVDMDAPAAPAARATRKPLVEGVDLYVTTTDLHGLPVPLRLSDAVVTENRYRNVHHFRFSGAPDAIPANDFAAEQNAALAFAARCTSSFPFAFEPMRVADAMALLETTPGAGVDARRWSDPAAWWPQFAAYRSAALGMGLTPRDADIVGRSFADGGILDNKPFGWAIDELGRRRAGVPSVRKLLYIEPAPEHPEDAPADAAPPDAVATAIKAFTLPRDETIREDLERVLARNRLIERSELILKGLDTDVRTAVRAAAGPDAAPSPAVRIHDARFGERDLTDLIAQYGVGYGGYQRLKVAALTDEIARIMAALGGLDPRSDEVLAIRYLVRAWRNATFTYYLEPVPGAGAGAGPRPTRTYNEFLLRFDLAYRLRRLNFVLTKIDWLVGLDADARAELAAAGVTATPASEPTIAATLRALSGRVALVYRALRRARELLASRDAEPVVSALAPVLVATASPVARARPAAARPFAAEAPPPPAAGAPPAGGNRVLEAVAALGLGRAELLQLLAIQSEAGRNAAATGMVDARRAAFDALADALAHRIAGVSWPASDICESTFGEGLVVALGTDTAHSVQRLIASYYLQYERYDMVIYPALHGTDAGDELDRVDVVRISPEDATALVDERGKDRARPKLAGTALGHFGAFVDRDWRANDIMWGRFDGSERLIHAILHRSDATDAARAALVDRALLAIVTEMTDRDAVDVTTRMLTTALTRTAGLGGGSAADAARMRALRTLVSAQPGQPADALVRQALVAAAEPERRLEYYQTSYEVDRATNAQHAVRDLTRSTRVIGRLLEGIAEEKRIHGSPLVWLARAGSLVWGLAEVSVPGSVPRLFFLHALRVLYVFELVMVAGGLALNIPAATHLGLALLGITVVVHFGGLLLGDAMRRRKWWLWIGIGVLVAVVLALAVLGAVDVVARLRGG